MLARAYGDFFERGTVVLSAVPHDATHVSWIGWAVGVPMALDDGQNGLETALECFPRKIDGG